MLLLSLFLSLPLFPHHNVNRANLHLLLELLSRLLQPVAVLNDHLILKRFGRCALEELAIYCASVAGSLRDGFCSSGSVGEH